MELEWDEQKRQWTLENRQLDFADVPRFDYDTVVTWPDVRRDYGESRFNSYGYLDGVLCTYYFTLRLGRLRVISMRKVNERERKRYEAGKDPGHS